MPAADVASRPADEYEKSSDLGAARLSGGAARITEAYAMTVIDLDRDTVKQGLARNELLLIDVREEHEFARGHIPGSVSHPLSTFDPEAVKALVEADGRRPVFSCASGVRSVHALAAAQGAGLDITEHYAGAFRDWYGAGEPIES